MNRGVAAQDIAYQSRLITTEIAHQLKGSLAQCREQFRQGFSVKNPVALGKRSLDFRIAWKVGFSAESKARRRLRLCAAEIQQAFFLNYPRRFDGKCQALMIRAITVRRSHSNYPLATSVAHHL